LGLAISKERKKELVQLYSEEFEQSTGVILADFRGLRVTEMEQLRQSIREADSVIRVVKNRLVKQALEGSDLDMPAEWLDDPTAIAFCHGEMPAVAKALAEVAKESSLTIKGGLMGTSILSSAEVQALASLPPREILLAQVLGTVNAPATQAAGIIASGIRQVLNLLQAYVDTMEGGAAAPQAA
jgi:large subunit ribosomal protein L10